VRVRVALASGEAHRQDTLEFGEPGRVEVEIGRRGAFLDMVGRAGPGNRDDVGSLGERPGDGERCGRDIPTLGERQERRQAVAVAPPVEPSKARVGVAEDVLAVEALDVLQKAAEVAAPDRREGDEQRARLCAGLNQPQFGVARPQRILRLDGGDRMDGVRTAQRVGRDLGEPDGADLSGLDQAAEFADRMLDRMRGSTRWT